MTMLDPSILLTTNENFQLERGFFGNLTLSKMASFTKYVSFYSLRR